MKRGLCVLALGVLVATSAASADMTTLVQSGATWQYATVGTDLWPVWSTAGYGSFDWTKASWNSGQAGFGNDWARTPTPVTFWAAGSDLALQTTFDLDGIINGGLTLNVASDNGFIIFVNGQQVAKANAEGYTSYWEYGYTVDASHFVAGTNLIQVLAEDHGGATFFDMQLKGDVTPSPVPAPGAFLLGSIGVSLVSMLRRRFA